eukprot:scaffold75561_cov55-Attheya_sp.AAC.12
MVGAVLWLQYGVAVWLVEIVATSVLFLDHGASAFSLRPLQNNGRPLSVRSSLDRSCHENISKGAFFLCGVPSSPATRRRCASTLRPTNTLLDSSREGGDSESLDDVSSTAKEEDVAASLVQQETLQAGGDNNTDPPDVSNNANMKAALEEAEALRSKARKLMAEATEAEATLREFTSSQKSRRDKESDAIVAQILTAVLGDGSSSSSLSEDGALKLRKMANVLREHHAASLSLSIHTLIRVVERIHEREKVARRRVLDSAQASQDGKASGKQFQIGDTSQSIDASQTELTQLAGLLDLLVDAASALDDDRLQLQEQEQPSDQEVGKDPSSQQQQQQQNLAERDYFGAPGTVAATLRSRIKELRRGDDVEQQRQLGTKFNSDALRSDSESVQDYVRRTIAGASSQKNNDTNNTAAEFNVTKFMMGVVQVPRWVPNTLLPFVIAAKEDLTMEDAKLFRSDVLGGSRFYCTSWDSMSLAAIYRGNFMPDRAAAFMGGLLSVDNNSARTTNSTISMKPTNNSNNTANLTQEQLVTIGFQNVRDRLAEAEGGLGDRIQLFLVEDPEWRPGFDDREPEPRPVILALPASVEPEQASERDRTIKVVTALSTLLTLVTTLAFSIMCFGLNPTIFNSVVNDNDTSQLFSTALPIFLGVLGLQVIHEAAHFLVAKKTGVKIGLPVPIPSLQIGTFGSITPLRSFPETRADLLDLALVGPAITMVLSLLLMVGGIWGTIQAPAAVLSGFPMVPAALCKTSLLVGSIVSALAPKIMMLPLSQPIPIHPAFMIGFTGLLSSAVNLLPIGRLDGGRICTAILGRRQAILASFFMLVALAALALSGMSTISIFWGLIVVLFQRYGEIPIRDEVTQVSDLRSGCYAVFLLLSSLAIAPFPGGPGSF